MDTEGRKATRFAAMAGGRFADEALSLVRTTGRRAVLRTFHRAHARATGRETSALHWPRADLGPHYDVVVTGGTLAGLWFAWELSRRSDLRVAVTDGGQVGASWPSRAGWILSSLRHHAAERALVSRSSQLYEETYTEHGFQHRLGRADAVRLAADFSELRRLQQLVAGINSPSTAELVEPGRACEVYGHLDAGGALAAVIESGVTTIEGDVLPWQLGGEAASRGTAIVERCAVTSVSRRSGTWLLETAQGTTETPILVDATIGADLLRAAGVAHGCLWRRWETMYTDPVQPFLQPYVLVQGVEVAQTVQGEIRLTSPTVAAPPGPTRPNLDAAAAAAAAAVAVVPALGRLRLVAQAVQAELLAPDGLAVAGDQGAAHGFPGLYRFGGLGPDAPVLVPALAEALVGRMLDERSPSWLEQFAPARLAGAGQRNGAMTAGTVG